MDVNHQETLSSINSADTSSRKKRRGRKGKALDKIDTITPDNLLNSTKTEETGSGLSLPVQTPEGSASAVSSLLPRNHHLDSDSHQLDIDTSSPPTTAIGAENTTPADQTTESKTSKYFTSPALIPSAVASSSTTTEPRSRGQKRQRINSEGPGMPSVAEMSKNSPEGKKKRGRTQVPPQEGGEATENEIREVVKLRKKGKAVSTAADDQPSIGASSTASNSTIQEPSIQDWNRDSQVNTSNGKSINTTASQLADRARTMKDREELARLRLDQQNLDEKLSANKNRMEALEAELGEVKKEREGLKEQSRKEIGFKDEVIKSQDRLVDDLKQSLTCNVCLGMFDDPHTIAPCGHTSCAPCLLKWFESPNSLAHPDGATREGASMEGRRRACGTCRTSVLAKPMPAFVLNDLILSLKSRLQTSEETSHSEPEVVAEGEAPVTMPETDRNKMWDHIFGTDSLDSLAKGFFVDDDDGGIARCRACGSEIYHDECTGCGLVFSDAPAGHFSDMSDMEEAPPQGHAFGDLGGPEWLARVAARGWDVDSGSDEIDGSEMDDFIVSDGSVQRSPRRARRYHLSDTSDDDVEGIGIGIGNGDGDGDGDGDDADVEPVRRRRRIIVSPAPGWHTPISITDEEDSNLDEEVAPPRFARRTGGRIRSQIVVDSDSDEEPAPYAIRHGVTNPINVTVGHHLGFGPGNYPQPNPDGFWSEGEEAPAYSDAGGSVSHYGQGYDRDSDPEQNGWDSGSEAHISLDGSQAYGNYDD